MRIKKIAFWSVFGLLSLLVLAVAWLWTADLGVFKPQIEAWVSEKTGREFAIDGAFNVDLTRHTVVIAEDIRFENAEWADDPQMIEIGRAEIRVDLRSLFSSQIIVELIDIDDVEIHLAQPADNDANWVLPIKKAEPATDDDGSGKEFEIFLNLIDINRVDLVYESSERDKPLDLRVEYLKQTQRPDNYHVIDLVATLGDRDISLSGEVGTQQALLAGKDIHYSFEGQLDTFEINSSGWIDDLANIHRPSLQLTASGPDIDHLTRMLGIGEDGEGDIKLVAALTPQENGPLVLDVKGNIGLTEFEAAGAFSDLQDLEQVDIDLLAKGPDLGRILRLVGIHQVREAPFMIDIDAQRQGPMLVVERARLVFADTDFNAAARIPSFPGLDDAKIDINIAGPDIERFRYMLRLPGEASGAFEVDFVLGVTPNNVEILDLFVKTSLGELRAQGELGDLPGYVGSTIDFQLSSESLGRLGGAYGLDNLPDAAFSVHGSAMLAEEGIQITTPVTGKVEEVTVSLDGFITLGAGIIGSNLSFGLVGANLAKLLGAFGVQESIPHEPFDFNGQLQVRNDGYRFRNLTGALGSSSLNVDGLLVPVSGLAGSHFNFAVSGPEFQEIIAQLGDTDVRPGPYELSGRIGLQSERIIFDDFQLVREAGEVSGSVELGMPVSRRWANFDVRAKGGDIRSLLRRVKAFEADEAPFSIDVRGKLRNNHLSFDNFEIGVGDANVQARGDIDFGDDERSTRFSLTGNIPRLSQLGHYGGRRPREQSIAISANVEGGGGVLNIENLNLKLDESDVNGSVRYTKGDVPMLEVDIQSESIVVMPLFEKQEFTYDPEPEFDDGRLIPDIKIPFEALRKFNATLDIDVRNFVQDSLQMRNIDLRVDLRDGAVNVRNFSFDARYGWIKSRAKVEPADGVAIASLELVARDFSLGLKQSNSDHQMTGNLDVKLDSTGNDLRTLVGNLDGVVFIETRSGRIGNSRTLQAIYGDMLSEILSTINPFYKSSPYTDFDCIVLPLQIVDGSVTGNPSSHISTDKIRMTPKSVINLKTEKINMHIRTTPQRGLTISGGEILNPYIKVVGTLAAPRLAVDETGALVSGSAAVATAGLSILARAAWDRLSRSKDPCTDIATKGKEALGERFPDFSGESDESLH